MAQRGFVITKRSHLPQKFYNFDKNFSSPTWSRDSRLKTASSLQAVLLALLALLSGAKRNLQPI